MCVGLSAPAIIGGLLSAGGTVLNMIQQQNQAADIARARNEQLFATMDKNDRIAEEARELFNKRREGYDAEQFAQAEQKAEDTRSAPLVEAVRGATGVSAPTTGDAPDVVKTTLATKMRETMEAGKEEARRLGRLGGFGDTWFGQGLDNAATGRDIGVQNDFASGNLAILPYLQDFAEIEATRPMSPFGSIIQGVGAALGQGAFGGSAAANPYQVIQRAPVPKAPPIPRPRPIGVF